jgi:hypothetical protein
MTAAEPVAGRRFLDPHFRWRGHEVSRMEAFADAVFGLVVALLFLQTKVPENLAELKAAMMSLVPFAVTFVLLAMVWVEHHQFFRRYGLRDKATFFGNLWLLFLVLVYAYPLKFLFTLLFVAWIAPIGDLTIDRMAVGQDQLDARQLMVFYGIGTGAIYATFALLYRHAQRRADDLGLDGVERHLTATSILECCVLMGFALASIVFALCNQPEWSGLIYCGIGPVMGVVGSRRGGQLRQMVAARGT